MADDSSALNQKSTCVTKVLMLEHKICIISNLERLSVLLFAGLASEHCLVVFGVKSSPNLAGLGHYCRKFYR